MDWSINRNFFVYFFQNFSKIFLYLILVLFYSFLYKFYSFFLHADVVVDF